MSTCTRLQYCVPTAARVVRKRSTASHSRRGARVLNDLGSLDGNGKVADRIFLHSPPRTLARTPVSPKRLGLRANPSDPKGTTSSKRLSNIHRCCLAEVALQQVATVAPLPTTQGVLISLPSKFLQTFDRLFFEKNLCDDTLSWCSTVLSVLSR